MDQHAAQTIRFGRFALDTRSGQLTKSGTKVRLQERPLRILEALLEQPGALVTREALCSRLWAPDTFVDFDNSLNNAVNRLRAALGDNAERPRFVETVGSRGYRFVAPISTAIAPPPPESMPRTERTTLSRSHLRLAVLPFRILRPDQESDFLAFSLPDAVSAALSGLESLAVRSVAAAVRFGSDAPDLATVASALDVNLVLTGSVLRLPDRVRISTQLVEAPSGTLLWTQSAEVPVDDIFDVPNQVVNRIVESLSVPLTAREFRVLFEDTPTSGKAYELYLRANELARSANTWTQARESYLASVGLDPEYAPAWARLGGICRLMGKYADHSGAEQIALAERALQRALGLNPELSIAHSILAQLEMETGRSHAALVRLLGRARERPADPQLFVALVQACRYVGLLDASRAAHERARRTDPTIRTSIAFSTWMSGDYTRAIDEARQNDDSAEGFFLALAGRQVEALPVLERIASRHGANRSWAAFIEMALAFARDDAPGVVAAAAATADLPFHDPDGLFFVWLMLARVGDGSHVRALRQTVEAGFGCHPALSCEPALAALAPSVQDLYREVERRTRRAEELFHANGGWELLFGEPIQRNTPTSLGQ